MTQNEKYLKKLQNGFIPVLCAKELKQFELWSCEEYYVDDWIANGWAKPEGFCDSAWDSISAFVMTLAHGGGNFYDGWMKNPKSAMISCNDGFRPVSFYLEALDEEAEA